MLQMKDAASYYTMCALQLPVFVKYAGHTNFDSGGEFIGTFRQERIKSSFLLHSIIKSSNRSAYIQFYAWTKGGCYLAGPI
jgi:peptidoglycan LD-endopeptidase LytH